MQSTVVIDGDTGSREGYFLFSHKRVGKDGKLFNFVKIRTMRNGKVTALGKYLRRAHIDELPNLLWNTLMRRQMRLVGPRPVIPQEHIMQPRDVQRRIEEDGPGWMSPFYGWGKNGHNKDVTSESRSNAIRDYYEQKEAQGKYSTYFEHFVGALYSHFFNGEKGS